MDGFLLKLYLQENLNALSSDERKLIYLRYYQEKTQIEIAEELGISQVQVSRLEKRILKKMREFSEK